MTRRFFDDPFFDANDIFGFEDDPFFNEEDDIFGEFDRDDFLGENSESSEEENGYY